MSRMDLIAVSAADCDRPETLVGDLNTTQKVDVRAWIALLAAEGQVASPIAATTGRSGLTVRRWRCRFLAKGAVRLNLDPPDNAPVSSLDEKSHIQGLDRTQPCLSMSKGRAGTSTRDDERASVTPLFAPRDRHQEGLQFPRTVNRDAPQGLGPHLTAKKSFR